MGELYAYFPKKESCFSRIFLFYVEQFIIVGCDEHGSVTYGCFDA